MVDKKKREKSLLTIAIINTVITLLTVALCVLYCIVDFGTAAVIFVVVSAVTVVCVVFVWREYALAVKARKRGNNWRGY